MAEIRIMEWVGREYSVISYVPQNLWMQNCYILRTEGGNVLIDPGYDCWNIVHFLRDQEFYVHAILLTHAHHDQMASAQPLSQNLGIPVYLHPAEQRILWQAPMQGMIFAKRVIEVPTNRIYLDEDHAAELSVRFGIELLYTPGHSDGGICIFCGNVVFTGDTITYRQAGRTDRLGGNRERLSASLAAFFAAGRDRGTETIFSGRGKPWSFVEALARYESGTLL